MTESSSPDNLADSFNSKNESADSSPLNNQSENSENIKNIVNASICNPEKQSQNEEFKKTIKNNFQKFQEEINKISEIQNVYLEGVIQNLNLVENLKNKLFLENYLQTISNNYLSNFLPVLLSNESHVNYNEIKSENSNILNNLQIESNFQEIENEKYHQIENAVGNDSNTFGEPIDELENELLSVKSERSEKKIQKDKITLCPHTERKHYAKVK